VASGHASLIVAVVAALGACDQRKAPAAPAGDAAPLRAADAASVASDAAPPLDPAPPTPGLTLEVEVTNPAREAECRRHDLAIRLVRGTGGGDVVAEEVFGGLCTGACSPEDKRDGALRLAEIKRRLARGVAVEAELDYNFTECQFSGVTLGRIDEVAGRQVAILVETFVGPHGVLHRRYQLAAEVCGDLFVSEDFGEPPPHQWQLDDLAVTADGAVLAVSSRDPARPGVLYRATLPEVACRAEVIEQVLEIDY
jgi:hypothetical protein